MIDINHVFDQYISWDLLYSYSQSLISLSILLPLIGIFIGVILHLYKVEQSESTGYIKSRKNIFNFNKLNFKNIAKLYYLLWILLELIIAIIQIAISQNSFILSSINGWPIPQGVGILGDGLSSIGIFLVCILLFFSTLLSCIKAIEFAFVQLFILGATGILLAYDLLFLFVSIEIFTFSVAGILFLQKDISTSNLKTWLLSQLSSSILIMLAMMLIYRTHFTLNFADLTMRIANIKAVSGLSHLSSLLLLMGVLAKMNFFPFSRQILSIVNDLYSSSTKAYYGGKNNNLAIGMSIVLPVVVFIFLLLRLYAVVLPIELSKLISPALKAISLISVLFLTFSILKESKEINISHTSSINTKLTNIIILSYFCSISTALFVISYFSLLSISSGLFIFLPSMFLFQIFIWYKFRHRVGDRVQNYTQNNSVTLVFILLMMTLSPFVGLWGVLVFLHIHISTPDWVSIFLISVIVITSSISVMFVFIKNIKINPLVLKGRQNFFIVLVFLVFSLFALFQDSELKFIHKQVLWLGKPSNYVRSWIEYNSTLKNVPFSKSKR